MTLRDMTISDVERLDEAGQDVRVFHMDEADFRAFYDRTARALWAYLYRLTRDGGRADDLLQETYYRFLRTTDVPADPAHRRNYLYRIATNLVRDEARRAARGTHVEVPGDDDRVVLHAAEGSGEVAAAARADVGRAMARLSARERELLWLAYAEGATHREIADVLGLKSGSIKLLLFRARRRLADLLRRPSQATKEER
jgi:RNA polymerase sigma-70 factor (ECF subfamily)